MTYISAQIIRMDRMTAPHKLPTLYHLYTECKIIVPKKKSIDFLSLV